MSVLSRHNNRVNTIAENADASLSGGDCSRAEEIITNHQEFHSIPSPKLVRMRKVLEVQKQLTEGTYDIEERLKVAIDRLLENFVA